MAIVNLYEAAKKEQFCVVSVPSIGLLQNLGIRTGTELIVESRYALGGPVLVRVSDAFTVAVGKEIATQIAVKSSGEVA